MFISRPSDPRTVLLWAGRWWFAGTGPSCPFGNLTHAAEVLVAHYGEEPKPIRLRLIYEPEGFTSVVAACPRADRHTLSAALAAEFPAVTSDDLAWGFDPILPSAAGHSTVLHFESAPGLFALVDRLAGAGILVETAWPFPTFLRHLPEEWTDSGAATIVSIASTHAVAYRHPADAGPEVRRWPGADAVGDVGRWLGAILETNLTEPVLLVTSDELLRDSFRTFIQTERYAHVTLMPLEQALGQTVILPRHHPAQLLPRPTTPAAQRVVIAASVALLVGTLGLAGHDVHARHAFADAARQDQVRQTELEVEVTQLRENARAISALRLQVDAGATSPAYPALLDVIARTIPADLVLDHLRCAGPHLAFEGWIMPGAAAETIERWREALVAPGNRWTIDLKARGGRFVAVGSFQP
jgi:hypothetical protein